MVGVSAVCGKSARTEGMQRRNKDAECFRPSRQGSREYPKAASDAEHGKLGDRDEVNYGFLCG